VVTIAVEEEATAEVAEVAIKETKKVDMPEIITKMKPTEADIQENNNTMKVKSKKKEDKELTEAAEAEAVIEAEEATEVEEAMKARK
jgi:hypothetical protein